jgi:hypothetical protein
MFGSLSVVWAVLPVYLAGAGLHGNIIGTPQAEFRQVYSFQPKGRVVIQNLYGDVRITTWNRDEVLVRAIKRSGDPRQLQDVRIVVDRSSDLLSIHTQYSGGDAERPASVEYSITVPRTANLESVRLVNGGLSISGLAGSIKATSVNGSIRAEKLGGQAELSTVNGELDAEFNALSPANSISLSSVNGPIRLYIPCGSGAQLFAHNLSGGIASDFGRAWRAATGHRLRTTVKGGGALIRVNNVNGGISIRST